MPTDKTKKMKQDRMKNPPKTILGKGLASGALTTLSKRKKDIAQAVDGYSKGGKVKRKKK